MHSNYWSKLLDLFKFHWKEIQHIYFYAIVSGLIQLSVPLGIQSIITFVMGAQMVTSIYILVGLVVIGIFLVGVCQIRQMKIIENVQQRLFVSYSYQYADILPKLNLMKVDVAELPDSINKFFEVVNLQKGISKILLDVPIATIQILLGIILLALYHPIFIIFGTAFLSILLLMLRYTSVKGIETSLKESKYKYETVSWLQDMVRVIKSLKFAQEGNLNIKKTDKSLMGYIRWRTDHFFILLSQYKLIVFFKVMITFAMLSIGTYLLVEQKLNIGEFIAAEIVILMMLNATEKLIGNLDSVYDIITGLEKIDHLLHSPIELEGKQELMDTKEGVQIELVNFGLHYEEKGYLFKNVSLAFPKNACIGIYGKEGTGKTTLLNVLNGNFLDFEGSYQINNISIQKYELEKLRGQIGNYIYPADIFKGTLFENITLMRHDIDSQDLYALIQEIGFSDFMSHFDEGLDTPLDMGGRKLAANIRKKILLLRALINKPKLVILDEPFAGLSDQVKELFKNYLMKIAKECTVVIASNDKKSIGFCESIYHIKNVTIEKLDNEK